LEKYWSEMKTPDSSVKFGFYDFFAGGGMAHIGLGDRWHCLMANDFSSKKARAYCANFPPANELAEADVWELARTGGVIMGVLSLSGFIFGR
jgi:site-specific DNA-cytosine methylase